MNPSKASALIFGFVAFIPKASGAAIAISAVAALSFGKIAAGSGGTVTVSPSGARSKSGGVGLLSSGNGSAARFLITGDPSAAYILSLPADGEANLSSGGSTMSLSGFTCDPSATSALNGSGSMTVNVGATLTVDAAKQPADYSGTYSVIVNYQ